MIEIVDEPVCFVLYPYIWLVPVSYEDCFRVWRINLN